MATKLIVNRPAPRPSELSWTDPAEQLRLSVILRGKSKESKERLTRCYICVAKALKMPPNDPGVANLCRSFN